MTPIIQITAKCGCDLLVSVDNFGTLHEAWTWCPKSFRKTSVYLEHARTLVRLYMERTNSTHWLGA